MLKPELLLLVYNKDVICIIDEGEDPVCTTINSPRRRANFFTNGPSYDPYIPRRNPKFYECSEIDCTAIDISSLTQVTQPQLNLSSCFFEISYKCESIRFNYFKNIDKLLFLSHVVPHKTFYLVDCLIYADGARICERKSDTIAHVKLGDLGTIVRQNKPNILSQEEFLCEENSKKVILCDLNLYIPFKKGLIQKEYFGKTDDILLKTGAFVVRLKYVCLDRWCGYSGHAVTTRRGILTREKYKPPGGQIYRCYYANKQQICKRIPNKGKNMYNERDWMST